MIRPAVYVEGQRSADVDASVAMALQFYAASGYERIAPMPMAQAAGIIIETIRHGVMLVAESEDGRIVAMICLHLEPYLFNPAVVIAQELAWWIEPEARGGMLAVRLVKEAEAQARALGAQVMRMATLPSSPETANRMLDRMGYRPSESYFVKELT